MIVAVQHDNRNAGPNDLSAPRWTGLLLKAGHEVRQVDVYRPDILQQLEGCQGFMWRWGHIKGMQRLARRLLPVIERELGLVVYPDQNTCWHYDDKIAQTYLLQALKVPTPQTCVWFDRDAAMEWAGACDLPVVLKLATGAGSSNVRLVKSVEEVREWIDRLFRWRVSSLEERQFPVSNRRMRICNALGELRKRKSGRMRARNAVIALLGSDPGLPYSDGFEAQTGYVLFQEFLAGNEYDTRVTVIGNRAFGFRRFNRENDFRASGSGRIDHDPDGIDRKMIRLGFKAARALSAQSCAIDGLYRQSLPVVGEVSYTYASWAVHDCPGHWEIDGAPEREKLRWVPGQMWPEEAQAADFVERLSSGRR